MRLSTIKLSGFKSFVDPTTLHLPTNMTGVVGPNGCGKSNIIDAVRWVMGESSASRLRGDSLTDVIFSGSAGRKPVSQATVELIFDNTDHTIAGEYASFNEISVKRTVSRDGSSNYYLNGTKCRRRDITDLFLGTGLGPRSYSIIEQGMISQIIEARPEDLRVYLEEAAGISKYKERRKETETRIRHTRENLDRLNDLREEIGKQLEHLRRQARQAERARPSSTRRCRKSAGSRTPNGRRWNTAGWTAAWAGCVKRWRARRPGCSSWWPSSARPRAGSRPGACAARRPPKPCPGRRPTSTRSAAPWRGWNNRSSTSARWRSACTRPATRPAKRWPSWASTSVATKPG